MNKFFLFTIIQSIILSTLSSVASVDRNLSIVGVYSQAKINFELETNSPYYTGNDSLPDASFSYGVLMETPLQGQWGFETGLIFLQRGFQVKNDFNSTKNVYRWKSLYIPLAGRFHPTRNFTGSIGLYANYGVSDVAIYSTTDANNITYQKMKDTGFKQFEYGMTYSAGMHFEINSTTSFLIEIRFNESWSNLMDTSLPNVDKREKATLSETQVYLGIVI